MPRIKINDTIGVSHELFSRLRARGFIGASGECTEDFVWYIAECLARDDVRVPYVAALTADPVERPAIVAKPVVSDDEETVNTVSPAKTINKDQIKSRMQTLYNK